MQLKITLPDVVFRKQDEITFLFGKYCMEVSQNLLFLKLI